MIVTVTLNPALDVSYSVDALVPHGSHRVRSVAERAGGKGINVASVLNRMGVPSLALVLAGGSTGRALADDLTARRLSHEVLTCVGETRRTVNVVSSESGDATIFNEPGPSVTRSEIDAVVARVHDHVSAGATVVAICGSLPRGAEPHAYEQIVVAARTPRALTLVDAEGEPLRAACAARADVALPNRIELVAATGADEETAGAKVLQHLGVRHVVGRTFVARPGQPLRGNPTGAGDAAAAAVAAGLAAEADWPEILRDAVAWSGAAVLQPVAGEVDPADVERLRAAATVLPA